MAVIFCPFCSLPGGYVRRAKNGRPFYECGGCKVRAFFNTSEAAAGFNRIVAESKRWVPAMRAELDRQASAVDSAIEAGAVLMHPPTVPTREEVPGGV